MPGRVQRTYSLLQRTYSLHADQAARQSISNSGEYSTEKEVEAALLPHIYLME